jgi:hypothetical protein
MRSAPLEGLLQNLNKIYDVHRANGAKMGQINLSGCSLSHSAGPVIHRLQSLIPRKSKDIHSPISVLAGQMLDPSFGSVLNHIAVVPEIRAGSRVMAWLPKICAR